MKKIWFILVITMMTFSLSACQTMHGLGEDVEDAGEWVQEKAK